MKARLSIDFAGFIRHEFPAIADNLEELVQEIKDLQGLIADQRNESLLAAEPIRLLKKLHGFGLNFQPSFFAITSGNWKDVLDTIKEVNDYLASLDPHTTTALHNTLRANVEAEIRRDVLEEVVEATSWHFHANEAAAWARDELKKLEKP